jgi:4-hydroxyphenylpyruvate dioxygenase
MAEDMAVHLSDSKFDSTVLANDSTTVFMTFLAPHAAARRSAIQTFIDHHEGPGVQHIALKSDDIFATVREMRARSSIGGMEFMPGASDEYYR